MLICVFIQYFFVVIFSIFLYSYIYLFISFNSGSRQPTQQAGSTAYVTEGNMRFDNQTYGQRNSIPGNEPEYLEIGQLQQLGFSNPSFQPVDHYQALDNEIGGPNNEYEALNFSGQSEA